MKSWEIVLIGTGIITLFIGVGLFFYPKPKEPDIFPAIRQRDYALITGVRIDPPATVTFYSDKEMTPDEQKLMMECFLAAVTIPEGDLWVNLRIKEEDRIAPFELGITPLGKLMLEQDYFLKKAVSSIVYPETETGRRFWEMIDLQNEARRSSEVKSWIYPAEVSVVDYGDEMEIDTAVLDVKQDSFVGDPTFELAVTQVVLPEVKDYVRYDEHFIPIQQAFRAVICGIWFKNKVLHSAFNPAINSRQVRTFEIKEQDMKYAVWKKFAKSYQEKDYIDGKHNRTWGGVNFDQTVKAIRVKKAQRQEMPHLRPTKSFKATLKAAHIPKTGYADVDDAVERTLFAWRNLPLGGYCVGLSSMLANSIPGASIIGNSSLRLKINPDWKGNGYMEHYLGYVYTQDGRHIAIDLGEATDGELVKIFSASTLGDLRSALSTYYGGKEDDWQVQSADVETARKQLRRAKALSGNTSGGGDVGGIDLNCKLDVLTLEFSSTEDYSQGIGYRLEE